MLVERTPTDHSRAEPRMRIAFLVRALTLGGAERQLIAVCKGLQRLGHDVTILVFYGVEGPLAAEAFVSGLRVVDLQKRDRWDILGFLRRLRATLADLRVEVLYSFLPSANVVAALATLGIGRPAVVWGIRSTDMRGPSYDWLGHLAAGLERLLAARAQAIIVNSASGVAHHAARGLPAAKLCLVRNGVDVDKCRFDPVARERLRLEWGLLASEPLVLLAGRHDPVKGIEVFLDAIQRSGVRAAIAGTPRLPYTTELETRARVLGLEGRVIWLGQRSDMTALLSAADLVCSASLYSEGSPNVLIEAMACGAVAVGTNVGDTAQIIADPERVAIPGSASDLARAIDAGIRRIGLQDGRGPDQRVVALYDMSAMVRNTELVLQSSIGVSDTRIRTQEGMA